MSEAERDVVIEAAHPSRPDREALLVAAVNRILAARDATLAAVEALIVDLHESAQAVVNTDLSSIRHREVLQSAVRQIRAALHPDPSEASTDA